MKGARKRVAAAKEAAARVAAEAASNAPPSSNVVADPVAFLERYTPHPISAPWRAVVRALYGQRFTTDEERVAFRLVCGHEAPTPAGYTELDAIAGRRAGKSELGAGLSVHTAVVHGVEHMKFLPPGTRGHVLLISRTQRQSLENFRYSRATVERHPELAAELAEPPLESLSGGELRFKSGVVVSVMPSSKASLRGFTILGAVLDETGWWSTADESADQDEEIVSAVRGGMLAPIGAPPRRLLVLSSPGPKAGYVWECYAKDHGRPMAARLVCHGGTSTWNPSVDPAQLEAERARDPRRYRREFLAEFVDAISAYFDSETVDRAAAGRRAEALPRRIGAHYWAAVDIGLKRDSSALAVAHLEYRTNDSPRVVVDGVWVWTPSVGAPLVAELLMAAMAKIARSYGVRKLIADQFAIIPLQEAARRVGLELVEVTATNSTKLQAFGRLREFLFSDRISLPKHERLLKELRSLEERITGGGNQQLGAPNRAGYHDDAASAVAWLMHALAQTEETCARKWARADVFGTARELARRGWR